MHFKPGKCKHFNGIQHPQCEAGVAYQPFLPSITKRELPCFALADSENGKTCQLREDPTAEEIAVYQQQHEAGMNRLRVVMTAMLPLRKEYRKTGGRGTVACPTGCGGTLYWSVASSNGHMHGRCSSQGCVSWME